MTKSVINAAGSKSTVLVVEDSGDDAELIRVAFHKAGFEHLFQTVSDVEEARRYLTGQGRYADRDKFPRADLVLLDHQMPGDGTAIVRWVREQPALAGLPIVVFSGSADPKHREEPLEAGANAYYDKPPEFGGFAASVKVIIETWAPGVFSS